MPSDEKDGAGNDRASEHPTPASVDGVQGVSDERRNRGAEVPGRGNGPHGNRPVLARRIFRDKRRSDRIVRSDEEADGETGGYEQGRGRREDA